MCFPSCYFFLDHDVESVFVDLPNCRTDEKDFGKDNNIQRRQTSVLLKIKPDKRADPRIKFIKQ